MMGLSGAIFFLWLPLLLGLVVWLHLALHKLGHAVGAWAVGYRYRLRFDWTGLVRDGGYSSVPPRDPRDARLKQKTNLQSPRFVQLSKISMERK